VGNLIGAYQQGNFGTSPVNSTFDLGLINFYAGAGFNGLLDQNFDANLRDCERYWQKSNSYGVAPLSASIYQFIGWQPASAMYVRATARFTQHMAKVPTVTLCGSVAGSNQVYLDSSAANVATSTTNQIVLDSGIHQIGLAAASAATAGSCLGGWVADTGW
jgi:hypothetical protein